jgi:Ca2+-transporting ATPase
MNSRSRPWHTLSATDAAEALAVDPAAGLSRTDVAERLARHGENGLSEARPRPLWLEVLDQFRNFLVIVLVFAAVLAWAIGDVKDAAVILVVVLFNAGLGFWQEHRAESTLAALKQMLAARPSAPRRAGVRRRRESIGARRHCPARGR